MEKHIINQVLFFAFGALLTSCSYQKVKDDELLWREKVEIEDGSHIMVYHSYNCSHEKPFFSVSEKKIFFVKLKYDVFDFCINERDASMLNAISRRNILERIENEPMFFEDSQDWQYFRDWCAVCDTSARTYKVYQALKDGNLIELSHGYFPEP